VFLNWCRSYSTVADSARAGSDFVAAGGGRRGRGGQGLPVQRETADPHGREVLAVPALAARVLAAALLERDHLRAARVLDDGPGDGRAGNRRSTDFHATPVRQRENLVECHIGAGLSGRVATVMTSLAATRYCLPPVLITANIVLSRVRSGSPLSRVRLLCSCGMFRRQSSEAARQNDERAGKAAHA
jgi:hypothetical protein